MAFLLISENIGNSFCGTYLRLSLCVLYSSTVFGGKLRTLRNVSRILAVVDESDAVLFHTDIISSYERLKTCDLTSFRMELFRIQISVNCMHTLHVFIYTGSFKMIVWVLTTCHTQHT